MCVSCSHYLSKDSFVLRGALSASNGGCNMSCAHFSLAVFSMSFDMSSLLSSFFFFCGFPVFTLLCCVSTFIFYSFFFFLYLLYAPLINCLFSMCVCSSFTPQGILSLTGGESGVSLYSLTTVTCAAYVFKFVFFSVCRIK